MNSGPAEDSPGLHPIDQRVTAPPRERFLGLLRASLADGSFLKLSLGAPADSGTDLRKVMMRRIALRGEPALSFVYRHATRDLTRNFAFAAAVGEVDKLLGTAFRTAHLFVEGAENVLDLRQPGRPRCVRHAGGPATRAPARPDHDRERAWLIAPSVGWLRDLGVTTDEGRVRTGMEGKFRQINRFVELLGHLIAAAGVAPGQPMRVVDMGCGKGYLTFAAWEWLRTHGWPGAEVCGVEARPELVELCAGVAAKHAPAGLRFERGVIASHPLAAADVLIALHACDTATDDALARGIAAGARLLMVAPCCHKEVRPRLTPPPVLAGALRHGILRERHAEFVTDALRAALLEWAGYETRVFEFIATEHTARNLMIAALQRGPGGGENARASVARDLASFYSVREQRLAARLGFALSAARREQG